MKYLLPLVILLVITACGKNTSAPENKTEALSSGLQDGEELSNYLEKPISGKVSQRGLYRMVRSSGIIDSPKTTTGKVIEKPVIELVKSTQRIPLMKGALMYLQYRIAPFPDRPAYVDLRRVLKHPAMTLPDGSVTTGSDFMVKRRVSSNQVIVYTGYGFDEDYELVEGDWTFEIWHGEDKLVEQTFTTYWPDEKEIDTLKPVLGLGNKVLTRMESPGDAPSGLNWPRVIVGGKTPAIPTELPNLKQTPVGSIKKP